MTNKPDYFWCRQIKNACLRGVFAKDFLGKYPEKNQTSGESDGFGF
jgi:hypothetical protein